MSDFVDELRSLADRLEAHFSTWHDWGTVTSSSGAAVDPIVVEPDTEGPSGLGVPAVAPAPVGQGLAEPVPAGAELEPDTEGL